MTPAVSAPRLARLVGDGALARPAYRSLAAAIMTLLADGRLVSGTRLPSERELTGALGCSRTTVTSAYAVLAERGYLETRRGSGSIAVVPGRLAAASRVLSPATDLAPDAIDLTCAATRAPAGILEAYAAALADLPSYLGDNGYAPVGLLDLRAVIAERFTRRGLATTPEQIIVTSGAVAGLAVISRALLTRGQRVLLESPSYPNAMAALAMEGARTVAIPVDAAGWDLDEAARIVPASGASAAYLIPDFHNPTGALLDDSGRERLAGLLAAADVRPIIDETIADIDLDGGPPVRPFGCFSPGAIVLGSAAKVFWGGLRIGWIRVPTALASRVVSARATLDLGAPILEQLVLMHLLVTHDGLPAARRTELLAARDATVEAVGTHLPHARFVVPRGGLTLWVDMGDLRVGGLVLAAAEAGLLVAAGPQFAPVGGFERFIRIPYVAAPAVMTDAVARLARAAEELRAGGVTALTHPPRAGGFVA